MNYSSRQLCANIFLRGTRIKNKNVIHIVNIYVLERIRTRGRGGGCQPLPLPSLDYPHLFMW